jgi:hypothetical protein
MLYIRISASRYFLLDELWILIPLILIIDIAIIVKVKKNRAKKKLQSEQLEKKDKPCKILHIAMNTIINARQIRGGSNGVLDLDQNYIEVDSTNCIVGNGLLYVNNHRIRQIVYFYFKSKAKNGVIYITKTALCHLVKVYGLNVPAFPIPIPDFIRISSWVQLVVKIFSVSCLGIPMPLLMLIQGPMSIYLSLVTRFLGSLGLLFIKDPGFEIIATDLISASFSSIRRRIPDQPDVVSVDLSHSKITMPEFSRSYECLLPDQNLFNSKCSLRPSQILDVAANADVEFPLTYDQVVNMQDVTKLTTVEFSDRFDISPNPKLTTNFQLRGTKHFRNPGKSKTVNFLKKFGDPEFIFDTEQWEISTSTRQDSIRIHEREL